MASNEADAERLKQLLREGDDLVAGRSVTLPPLRAGLRDLEGRDTSAQRAPGSGATSDYKGKVDFAIITIKEEEFEVVLERFPVEESVHGRRIYNISRLVTARGDTYVVAVVRCIEQGNGEAQAVAHDLIEELEPNWLLVVGIAGGVPSTDFTLGDVVVSSRIFDFSVEAVLNDQTREFAITGGPLAQPAAAVVANLRAMDLGPWNEGSNLGCVRPKVTKAKPNFYGDLDWQSRVRGSLKAVQRAPIVIAGAIASSDRLMKDEELPRLWLKTARQLLAIEMESAGVYRAARSRTPEVPTIAIRGISDIVGFKRDPGWTRYACHSAASFAHAFLRAGPIALRGRSAGTSVTPSHARPAGLVAIGPRVTLPGDLVGAAGSTWQLELCPPFVLGDEAELTRFCDSFCGLPREDRFVAVEAHGEGRLLVRPPRWRREGAALRIDVEVEPLLPRTDATTIGEDLAMDLDKVPMDMKHNEHVSGVDWVPQCITRVLSTCKGGWGVGCEFGSRVAELHERFGRDRITSFIALELIRNRNDANAGLARPERARRLRLHRSCPPRRAARRSGGRLASCTARAAAPRGQGLLGGLREHLPQHSSPRPEARLLQGEARSLTSSSACERDKHRPTSLTTAALTRSGDPASLTA